MKNRKSNYDFGFFGIVTFSYSLANLLIRMWVMRPTTSRIPPALSVIFVDPPSIKAGTARKATPMITIKTPRYFNIFPILSLILALQKNNKTFKYKIFEPNYLVSCYNCSLFAVNYN